MHLNQCHWIVLVTRAGFVTKREYTDYGMSAYECAALTTEKVAINSIFPAHHCCLILLLVILFTPAGLISIVGRQVQRTPENLVTNQLFGTTTINGRIFTSLYHIICVLFHLFSAGFGSGLVKKCSYFSISVSSPLLMPRGLLQLQRCATLERHVWVLNWSGTMGPNWLVAQAYKMAGLQSGIMTTWPIFYSSYDTITIYRKTDIKNADMIPIISVSPIL